MAINNDITVIAGKKTSFPDVETKTTIKHAKTGKIYADETEARDDINNPATDTTEQDVSRDVAVSVNKFPGILGGTS